MGKWIKLLLLALEWAAIQKTKPKDQNLRKEDQILQDLWSAGKAIFSPVVTKVEKAVAEAETLDDLILDDSDNNLNAFIKNETETNENGKS